MNEESETADGGSSLPGPLGVSIVPGRACLLSSPEGCRVGPQRGGRGCSEDPSLKPPLAKHIPREGYRITAYGLVPSAPAPRNPI